MIQVYHLFVDTPTTKKVVDSVLLVGASDVEAVMEIWDGYVVGLTYAPVAIVETDNLDMAFTLTNNLTDKNWSYNKKVMPLITGTRSTTIGDIFIQNGTLNIVVDEGFAEITRT